MESCRRNLKFSEYASSPAPMKFILFTETQPSLTLLRQVLTELLGLPSLGGFKGGNEKKAMGLTLPRGTVFESVDSKQEVACVRDHLSHSCENSQEGFFPPLNVCGEGETE